MKRRIFEEKLYLYIKGELSDTEMKEMRTEIEKSPDSKLLYEKMNGFLKDSKQLLKKVEIKHFETGRIIQIHNKAKTQHHHNVKIFQPLTAAALLLLILGLIYIFFKPNIIRMDRQDGQNNEILTADQKMKESAKETTANSINEKGISNRIVQHAESMTANLADKSGQNSLIADYAPVKRIVYLTDNPKVKIYWMTKSN
jgi:flagellar biosynthesis/type III secretory pathway M-ring protein FliF/YscJ